MARDFYKATNLETGEERLTAIPPAVQVIARRKLHEVIKGDVRLGFYAAVYGGLNRDVMDAVADGSLTPEAFMDRLTEWLWTWEPDIVNLYDADGNIKTPEVTEAVEGDPLP